MPNPQAYSGQLEITHLMNDITSAIMELAQQTPGIAVVWLYGSRAKGTHDAYSDYDLAVAFKSFIKDDPLEKRLRPECLEDLNSLSSIAL